MAEETRRACWPVPVVAIALACLVGAVFFPIVGFEFIDFDVTDQVIKNPHIRGITWNNLQQIFTSRCIASYYPVRTLSYAIDYELWGLDAGGFKFTNGLIHLANVYLVFWLALRLLRRTASDHQSGGTWWDVSLAAFAAGVFGIHPVVVEPVTWVPGREELLMTIGALGCLHLHMTARRLADDGARLRTTRSVHACAAFCCALACLSNAVGAVVPLLVTAWDVVFLNRPKLRRIVCGTFVLWVIGAATIASKALAPPAYSLVLHQAAGQRLMMVPKVYWLNLKTLFWPTKLGLFYEVLPPESPFEPEVILGGMALGVTCVLIWKLRRRKSVFFGCLWFGLALGPVSQILPHHMPQADRFLYLPLVGLTVALTMALRPLASLLKERSAVVGASVAGGLLLFLLAILNTSQVRTWQNDLTVWDNSLRVDRDNLEAHSQFAYHLAEGGHFERAASYYQMAITRDPKDVSALAAAGWLFGTYDDVELRDYALACKLLERACQLTNWEDRRLLDRFAAVHGNLAADLVERGEFGRAIEIYERVHKVNPSDHATVTNLAWLLATCDDQELRNPNRAVQLAEMPSPLKGRPVVIRLKVLAVAYAEAGQLDAAIITTNDAIRRAEAIGDAPLAKDLRSQLNRHRNAAAGSRPSIDDLRPPMGE